MKKRPNRLILLIFVGVLSACQNKTATPIPPILPAEEVTFTPLTPIESTIEATTLPSQNEQSPAEPLTAITTPLVMEDGNKLPNGENFEWRLITSEFTKPLGLADIGNGNLLIVEQGGVIKVLQNGQVLPTPFINLQDRVGSRENEQGLLGLALDQDYLTNGIFYLNYTNKNGHTVISRFRADENLLTANPNSEQQLMLISQPYGNHNGGNIVFGPDGFLYIGLGDGGSGGDPQGNAQNLETLLGKMLRIAVRDQELYAVPGDNPFVHGGGRSEIFAVGLRNPWRFSFDVNTGNLYIADVGQGDWEEINFASGNPIGLNYGWDFREGKHLFEGSPPSDIKFTDPILEYDHSVGCSVTGGFVYRGEQLPEFYGVYLYGDYCSGVVWGAIQTEDGAWDSEQLFSSGVNISSFGQDLNGEVYLIDHGGGIYQLIRKNGS